MYNSPTLKDKFTFHLIDYDNSPTLKDKFTFHLIDYVQQSYT